MLVPVPCKEKTCLNVVSITVGYVLYYITLLLLLFFIIKVICCPDYYEPERPDIVSKKWNKDKAMGC